MTDGLQVVGPRAGAVPAQVVDLGALGDRPDVVLVGDSVGEQHDLRRIPPAKPDIQRAVSVGDGPAAPPPAPVLVLDDAGQNTRPSRCDSTLRRGVLH